MFVGGTDTTATTLEWAVSELMKHFTIMKKAQEEVRRVVGNKSKVEENDINQMHYLKCVVKETMRLHPSLPLLVPRETISSVKLKGYDIPAKTTVYFNAWTIQRDPKYVIANLLYWFDWKLPETNEGEQDIDMSEIFGMALTKKEPLQLKPISFLF